MPGLKNGELTTARLYGLQEIDCISGVCLFYSVQSHYCRRGWCTANPALPADGPTGEPMIPGSALRRLTSITGLQATKDAPKCYRLQIAPGVALFSFKDDEKEACSELRQLNWRRVSNIIFEKQCWKCGECGRRLGLSVHHKIFRSRWRPTDGPLDVEDQLVALCSSCHSAIHDE